MWNTTKEQEKHVQVRSTSGVKYIWPMHVQVRNTSGVKYIWPMQKTLTILELMYSDVPSTSASLVSGSLHWTGVKAVPVLTNSPVHVDDQARYKNNNHKKLVGT